MKGGVLSWTFFFGRRETQKEETQKEVFVVQVRGAPDDMRKLRLRGGRFDQAASDVKGVGGVAQGHGEIGWFESGRGQRVWAGAMRVNTLLAGLGYHGVFIILDEYPKSSRIRNADIFYS